MGKAKTYDELIEVIEGPVVGFLLDMRRLGRSQVLVSEVKKILNRLGGKQGILAEAILLRLQDKGAISGLEMAGKDGFVYLKGEEDGRQSAEDEVTQQEHEADRREDR